MFLGNNGAIIGNSKFYRITLPLGIGMALSVYFMNKLFYFKLDFGTDGLALATLITILFFNTVKLFFVKSKFLITPFTDKSWKMFVIILVLFCSFYFWNFSVPIVEIFNRDISPIFNLILKSILITVLYLFIVIKFSISNQINSIVRRYIKL